MSSEISCSRESVAESRGLVVNVDGDLLELVAVGAGVVGTEHEFAAGFEAYAHVGLCTTAIAAVCGSEFFDNLSGHEAFPSLEALTGRPSLMAHGGLTSFMP